MKTSKRVRIVRRHQPSPMTRGNKREIRQCLRSDFEWRCAYCMVHEKHVSEAHFDIDHFQPESSNGTNDYGNLFWSCKACNGFKHFHWPTSSQLRKGVRYANPCDELDYGKHLFENPKGELVAATRCGAYHLEKIYLNRPDLVKWRKERTDINALVQLAKQKVRVLRENGHPANTLAVYGELIAQHERALAIAIPLIPSS